MLEDKAKPHILLASGSPRRRDLLLQAGYDVSVHPSNADETWPEGLALGEAAICLARRKLDAVVVGDGLRLAADTVVALDNQILGKPKDASEAQLMLRSLSGRVHQVITGYVLRRGPHAFEHAVVTEVHFRPLSDADIERYVAIGESLDKAGAYGIQGGGGALTASVTGSYTNVVGLPLAEVLAAIRDLGQGIPLG